MPGRHSHLPLVCSQVAELAHLQSYLQSAPYLPLLQGALQVSPTQPGLHTQAPSRGSQYAKFSQEQTWKHEDMSLDWLNHRASGSLTVWDLTLAQPGPWV